MQSTWAARKGNYTLLARKLAAAVGWERLILQPFDLWLGCDAGGCLLGKLLEHNGENIYGISSDSTTGIMRMAWQIKTPNKKCILPTLREKTIPVPGELVGVLQLLARIMGRFLSLVLCQVAVAAERRSCPYYQVGETWGQSRGSFERISPIR